MSLSTLVLEEGTREGDPNKLWESLIVGPDVAVDILFDDVKSYSWSSNPTRNFAAWTMILGGSDRLIRVLIGKRAGDQFANGTGRQGAVVRLRHKYVARLHFVLQNYETRFPEVMGFRRIAVDAEQPGGLNGFIAELKERNDWLESEYENYSNGPWPLEVLAHRTGLDGRVPFGGVGRTEQAAREARSP